MINFLFVILLVTDEWLRASRENWPGEMSGLGYDWLGFSTRTWEQRR